MSIPSKLDGPGWPTWFQAKSSPPKAATVRFTMSPAKASSRRSPDSAIAWPPASMIYRATAAAPSGLMSTTATAAPSRAKVIAPALPIPDAPAVTRPTLFAIRMFHTLRLLGRSLFQAALRLEPVEHDPVEGFRVLHIGEMPGGGDFLVATVVAKRGDAPVR